MSKAAIQGTYADYRRVKGRAVLQIVIEVPIEQAPLVHQAFGEPKPDGSTWVAVALLEAGGVRDSVVEPSQTPPPQKDRKRFHELPAPQQAGMLCDDPRFRAFLREEMKAIPIITADHAAEWVRQYCQVQSRAQLNHNSTWLKLLDRWQAWKAVEAA